MPGINYTNLKVTAAPSLSFPAAGKTAASDGQPEDLFHHLLNIVNPLQHLPLVGTIYRAVTGEHIGSLDKIAGDTLYGGLWGGVSATADVVFEAITGKSAEDTVLAWFDHKTGDTPTAVAAAAPAQNGPASRVSIQAAPVQAAALPMAASDSNIAALSSSLAAKGVDGDLAGRALDAYRRTIALSQAQMPVRTALQ